MDGCENKFLYVESWTYTLSVQKISACTSSMGTLDHINTRPPYNASWQLLRSSCVPNSMNGLGENIYIQRTRPGIPSSPRSGPSVLDEDRGGAPSAAAPSLRIVSGPATGSRRRHQISCCRDSQRKRSSLLID